MLPTIDISLIGVLLAVWNVVKIIWDYTSKALNWLMQQALALLIGSKFWATVAFLAVALTIIGFLSTFLSSIADYILALAFPDGVLDSDVSSLIGFFIDGDDLTSCVTFIISSWATYHIILGMDFTRRLFVRFYTLLSQAWKT